MKKLFLIMLAPVCSGVVWAADYVDTAKVISSTPIYERVSEPKQECWYETISSAGTITKSAPVEERSIGGALVGGIIGGVVGSQIGAGEGRTAATAAGAIAGAIIGDRAGNQPGQQEQQTSQAPQVREERHCRQVESFRDVIRGYDVIYRYKGQDVTTKLPYQPGDTVRVGISVMSDNNGSDVRDYRINDSKSDARSNRNYDRRDRRHSNDSNEW